MWEVGSVSAAFALRKAESGKRIAIKAVPIQSFIGSGSAALKTAAPACDRVTFPDLEHRRHCQR